MKNKEIEETFEPIVIINDEISDLERAICSKSEELNIPALCAFFEVNQHVVETALSKK